MFVNHVRRAMDRRFAILEERGADPSADVEEFEREMERLENLCANEGIPDLFLYDNWGTPFEIGLVDANKIKTYYFAPLRNHAPAHRTPVGAIEKQLQRIDEIMIRVAAFTGERK